MTTRINARPTTAQLADEVDRVLQSNGTAQRAEHERAYLKSSLVHYGVNVPTIRATVRYLCRRFPGLSRDEVIAVSRDLWARGIHEDRMAAVELLVAQVRRLHPADLHLVEELILQAGTWALVDPLAINVVGALLEREAATVVQRLDRWAGHEDLWLRRAALLAHLPGVRAGGGDFARFTRYAEPMIAEREFFIRKAIGWVLRETGRKNPELVARWVEERIARLSGVTVREAVKWLEPDDRDRLLNAYRNGGARSPRL